MPKRQYVACTFRPNDTRKYTYHYDGDEPIAVGDSVKVEDRSGDGWKKVTVVEIVSQKPPFATKPILGKVEPESTEKVDTTGEDFGNAPTPEEGRNILEEQNDQTDDNSTPLGRSFPK